MRSVPEDRARLREARRGRARQGRKRVIQRRFNVGVLEATPERKAWHALRSPREMIACPKISQIEWKTTELGAWQSWRFLTLLPPRRAVARRVSEPLRVVVRVLRRLPDVLRLRALVLPAPQRNHRGAHDDVAPREWRRRGLCGFQSFGPTSMCAYSNGLDPALWSCFENSTRAIDSSKNQPNRL